MADTSFIIEAISEKLRKTHRNNLKALLEEGYKATREEALAMVRGE